MAAATATEGPGPAAASTRIITVTQCPGGCGWTLQYSCPGQPRGSKGPAGDDGTEGYRCCCGAGQPWRVVTRPQPIGETVVVRSKETDLYIDHGIAITPVANTDEYAPNCCGELLSNGEHRHSNCNHCYNGVPLNRLKKPTGTESKPVRSFRRCPRLDHTTVDVPLSCASQTRTSPSTAFWTPHVPVAHVPKHSIYPARRSCTGRYIMRQLTLNKALISCPAPPNVLPKGGREPAN